MKRAVLCLFLFGFLATGQAQKVIQLEETKVDFEPRMVMVKSDKNATVFKVAENYAGEFADNPLRFVIENFDIQNYMDSVKKENFDSYEVNFKSRKGGIIANYDKNGELVRTYQKFKDIALPIPLRKQLVKEYKGWTMTGNTYTARGEKDKIDKEAYRITLQMGNKNQKIKIIPERQSVASSIKF